MRLDELKRAQWLMEDACDRLLRIKRDLAVNDPEALYDVSGSVVKVHNLSTKALKIIRGILEEGDDLERTIALLEDDVDEAYERVKRRIKHTRILLKMEG